MTYNANSNGITWRELLSNDVFRKVYNLYVDQNPSGGSLHIVLEDYNNEDNHIEYCLKYALDEKDYIGAYIASEILKVSIEERNKYNWFIPDDLVEW